MYTNVLKKSQTPVVVYVDENISKLKKEDAKNEANGSPLRVAKIIETDLNMLNSGEWIKLPNGQNIWQLTVKCPDALATLLYYKKCYIPAGGKLFLYNAGKDQILGAYTPRSNPNGKEFVTEFVGGDEFTLEYVAPENNASTDDKPIIEISGIAYGYNHIKVYSENTTKNFGTASNCMVNINCSEGDNWQNKKRGVARTVTPIGRYAYYCSGTVVNNTAKDFTPYYLTAHHCFYTTDGSIYAGDEGINMMLFYFNYELPGCEDLTVEPGSNTMFGAKMLVNIDISGGSDGALIRLNQNIPDDYYVYYNGWDRTNTPAQSGVTIHHPSGDVKKISTFKQALTSSKWNSSSEQGADNAHWRVIFAETANGHSITEGGSSGSPIFNQNGLVVGTLTGGSTKCNAPNNPDYYGKFWYHWDQYGSNTDLHMKKYLDPINTGQNTLQGAYSKELLPSPRNLTVSLAGYNEDQANLEWDVPLTESGDPNVSKYYIYRNNSLIGETNNTSYLDANAGKIGNNVCYKVTALYDNQVESRNSNIACVFIGIPVTDMQIMPSKLRLTAEKTHQMTVSFTPENASNTAMKSWVSSDNDVARVDKNGLVTAVSFGTATITATSEDGNFTASSTIEVYTVDEGSIKANEAFSPNGDGINDYFIIERIEEYPDNELTVFDRSGAIHYRVKGYANNWDGTANMGKFKGKKVPVGTYYYRLKVKDHFDINNFIVIRY